MKYLTIANLLLLVTWCAIAMVVASRFFARAPFQGATHDIPGTTFVDHGLYDTTKTSIDDQALMDSPAWNPADADPPLSARSALSIAEDFRLKRLRDKDGWQWGLDSLTLYPLDGKNNKWCWCIHFTAYTGGVGSGMPPELSVFILMNGHIVMPQPDYNYLEEAGLVHGIVRDSPIQ